jgi:hypothetical protein
LGVIVVATLTGAIVAVAVDRLASKHAAPSCMRRLWAT